MKTKEELNALKKEIETVGKKLCTLSEEEREQVLGGAEPTTRICPGCGRSIRNGEIHRCRP